MQAIPPAAIVSSPTKPKGSWLLFASTASAPRKSTRRHRGLQVHYVHLVGALQPFKKRAHTCLFTLAVQNPQSRQTGRVEYLVPVRLGAAAGDQQRPVPLALQLAHDLDGAEPTLVRIETGHLGDDRASAQAAPQLANASAVGRKERVCGQAIGNHDGIDAEAPHSVLHVTAHGRDDRGLSEAVPIDPLEAKHIVCVPKDARVLSASLLPQQPVKVKDRIRRMPFLGEDDRVAALGEVWPQDLIHQVVATTRRNQGACSPRRRRRRRGSG